MADPDAEPEHLAVETLGRVRRLTLDRTDRRNALTFELLAALVESVAVADADPAVGCIVIRGAGTDFCTGFDLSPDTTDLAFDQRSRADELALLEPFAALDTLWHSSTPVIAQVHGNCLGAGTDLAFNADVTIAAADARFGYPPVRSMGSPTTHMWAYLAGPQWAKRLLLTGDTIDGETAARAGFVLEAVDREELDAHVLDLAGRMALVPPEVAAANKAICNQVLELMGRARAQELAREANVDAHQSPSAQEFGRIAAAEGLRAALAWQNENFS